MTRAIGTDVVEVARLRGYLARVGRLGERLFTPAERQACAGRTESLAARLAAKEAVLKALGAALEACGAPPPTGWRYRDVEVVGAAHRACGCTGRCRRPPVTRGSAPGTSPWRTTPV